MSFDKKALVLDALKTERARMRKKSNDCAKAYRNPKGTMYEPCQTLARIFGEVADELDAAIVEFARTN